MHTSPDEVQPETRRRLLELGAQHLDTVELLSLLVGGKDAARLKSHFSTLAGLSRAAMGELMAVSGVGLVRACRLLAAFELGRRRGAARTRLSRRVPRRPPNRGQVVRAMVRQMIPPTASAILAGSGDGPPHPLMFGQSLNVGVPVGSLLARILDEVLDVGAFDACWVISVRPGGAATASERETARRLRAAAELLGIEISTIWVLGTRAAEDLLGEGARCGG